MGACGQWAWSKLGENPQRWFCGSGRCPNPRCVNIFWSRRIRLISALIDEYGLSKFFTLTLDRKYISDKMDPWDYIHYPWSKFRKRMKRLYDFRFVAILEHHKNKKYPHIHGFTNIWMSQKKWSRIWDKCKGGRVVWVEKVESESVSEYVSKQIEVARYVGKENLSAGYKEKRGHRTLWRSENTKAQFELTQGSGWSIIKEKVFNDDGTMTDYYAGKGVWSYGQKEH